MKQITSISDIIGKTVTGLKEHEDYVCVFLGDEYFLVEAVSGYDDLPECLFVDHEEKLLYSDMRELGLMSKDEYDNLLQKLKAKYEK